MQTSELIELAAQLATNGPAVVHKVRLFSTNSLQQYWTSSKCRLDNWSRELKSYKNYLGKNFQHGPPPENDHQWCEIRLVIEEIITSDILTRVWTAVVQTVTRDRNTSEFESAIRNVLLGHMEARNRALNFIVNPAAVTSSEAVGLNRLRRRSERWTDLLLGCLLETHNISNLAFETRRAEQFSDDLQRNLGTRSDQLKWSLMLASLREAFSSVPIGNSPNAELNAQIGQSILACFPTDAFNSTGSVDSLWQARIDNVTNEAQVLLDQILYEDSR